MTSSAIPRSRRRQALRVAAFFALLGALSTVALCWAAAVWAENEPVPEVTGVATFGAHHVYFLPRELPTFTAIAFGVRAHRNAGLDATEVDPDAALPYWSAARTWTGLVEQDEPLRLWYEFGFGWPWRAMKGLALRDFSGTAQGGGGSGTFSVESGVLLPGEFAPLSEVWADVRRVLPLRPIWPGFAASTAMHGLVWWGVWAAIGLARRARRRRRGGCARCGYDLRGTPEGRVCPECGGSGS